MLNLSDEQIQDLMFVRQVDYAKHCVLGSQREAVAASIHQDSPTPIVNFNKLSASAIQLQQQALDEHDVVHRVTWAVHCGVCCASSSCSYHPDQLSSLLFLCVLMLVISNRLVPTVNLLIVMISCGCMAVAQQESNPFHLLTVPPIWHTASLQ